MNQTRCEDQGICPGIVVSISISRKRANYQLFGNAEAGGDALTKGMKVSHPPNVVKYILVESSRRNWILRKEPCPKLHERMVKVCGLKSRQHFERLVLEERV